MWWHAPVPQRPSSRASDPEMGTARSHRRQTSSCSTCGWIATPRWLERAPGTGQVLSVVEQTSRGDVRSSRRRGRVGPGSRRGGGRLATGSSGPGGNDQGDEQGVTDRPSSLRCRRARTKDGQDRRWGRADRVGGIISWSSCSTMWKTPRSVRLARSVTRSSGPKTSVPARHRPDDGIRFPDRSEEQGQGESNTQWQVMIGGRRVQCRLSPVSTCEGKWFSPPVG